MTVLYLSLHLNAFLKSPSPLFFATRPVLTAAAYFLMSLVARFNAWEAARLRALSLEARLSLFYAPRVCMWCRATHRFVSLQ